MALVLQIGPLTLGSPVVLAPMAGVTNPPFRSICRRFGPDGLYVCEMVASWALVMQHQYRHRRRVADSRFVRKTAQRIEFWPEEQPRSLQLYTADAWSVGEAIRILRDEDAVDHIDLNFGCPARKVTRHGGGAALPFKRRLVEAILHAAVDAAGPDVPVTAKFRVGIDDRNVTFLDLGRIAQDAGVAAIALHARTAAQLYSGEADWHRIAELKAAVTDIPVLGNGDIWEAADAVRMMRETGCDGVVIGRGCLGRPWLFGQIDDALAGRPVAPLPCLGDVALTMRDHAALLVSWLEDERDGMTQFRKHTGWYFAGYPVGSEIRRRAAMVSTIAELDDILGTLDPSLTVTPEGARAKRGHTNGPQQVSLPDGWLDDPDEAMDRLPGDAALAVSGG
jgi:nifR3 family TIM-barrel protein